MLENGDDDDAGYRVLSVQSHVVSGYVGNKSACFPLQVLGFEVDFINSVHFSNHTGYKHVKGQRLNADELQNIYDGLKLNDLLHYTHILTGYVGTVAFLKKLVNIIKELKGMNPNLYYVCDPVMGDNNKLYVPPEVLPVYRDHIIPLSDLITPNQFETELLTGITIKSKGDAIEAMNCFHERGVRSVVISSIEVESVENLLLLGSTMNGDSKSVICMEIPKIPANFTGTGDILSAMLLAWMAKTGGDLKVSCENAVNTLHCILKRTLQYASGAKDKKSCFPLELKLIQSKKDIESPCGILKCYFL